APLLYPVFEGGNGSHLYLSCKASVPVSVLVSFRGVAPALPVWKYRQWYHTGIPIRNRFLVTWDHAASHRCCIRTRKRVQRRNLMNPRTLILAMLALILLSACVAPISATPPAAPASEYEDNEHDHATGSADQLGEVAFPVSCTPEAQAEFNQG